MIECNNEWGVRDSRVSWFETILTNHTNITSVSRSDDIVLTVHRRNQKDSLTILCLDEYTMSYAAVQRAQREFGDINIIFVGGNWNGYSHEAKSYCLECHIGLYNASEINGALCKNNYWSYDRDN
jgi:hypothetical protein